jgi:hypothetical protein
MKNALAAAILALALAGCTRDLIHREVRADGSWSETTYRNAGFDTKVGKLELIKDPNGTLKAVLENLDAQSAGMRIADKALDVAGKVVGKP